MKLGNKEVGVFHPTYFIADIASNHDGDLDRAIKLIDLAAKAGADAVKFQHFRAETIVSDYGFNQLGPQSHQKDWLKSVYDTYKQYETPLEWTETLCRTAHDCGVDFLTTPYDPDILPDLAPYVCAWKIGSGDITYKQLLIELVKSNKPILLATGASTPEDIARALDWLKWRKDIVLMQCNTNYTGEKENLKHLNLAVLATWWGGGVIGFSDHTPGHAAVLGAISLAASVIEKHFTDDNSRIGPDHGFSMNPWSWSNMVLQARELKEMIGDSVKRVEDNEKETVVLQRRAIRTARTIKAGEKIAAKDLVFLRPCPPDALQPFEADKVIGVRVQREISAGDYIGQNDLSSN